MPAPAVPPELCTAVGYIPWSPQASFFCSQQAMDRWIRDEGLSPDSLRCRNQPTDDWGPNAPNCYYTSGDHDLLLLRTAGVAFDPPPAMSPAEVRAVARRAVWRDRDPFAAPKRLHVRPWEGFPTGAVTRHAAARGYEIRAGVIDGVLSRAVWFVPATPIGNRFAIYHEGHGGAAVDIGASTIDWLLDRGWQVIALDMPLSGLNAADVRPGLTFHNDLAQFDDGRTSPVAAFLLPVKAVVDLVIDEAGDGAPEILMIGVSGGGWTTYVYSAMDPRIDWAVPIAGGRPVSQRLDLESVLEVGDYEQSVPHLYDAVGHEALMTAAGRRGGLIVFNERDPCCYRVSPDDPLIDYVAETASRNGTMHRVFVDPENPHHSLGPRGRDALEAFLNEGARMPDAPARESVQVRGSTVSFRWAPGGGLLPMGYLLEVGRDPGRADVAVLETDSSHGGITAANAPPGTYYVRVRATSPAGVGAPSSSMVATVGPCPQLPVAPGRPSVRISGGAVHVEWGAPTAGCAPTGYLIEAGSASGLADITRVPVGLVSGVSTPLPPPGVYYLRVRATNGAGTGAASSEVRVTIY